MRIHTLRSLLGHGPLLVLALAAAACDGDDFQYGPEICDDSIDNDGDGALDCDDRDCVAECTEVCDNGTDDDDDGLVDCADEDCFGPSCTEVCGDGLDNDEDGLLDCLDIDCVGSCPEICDDAIDNDGDGSADCVDSDCLSTCDADGDGFFAAYLGYDDCEDGNADINPAANEVCDKIDNDCDGLIDDNDSDVRGAIFYRDDDGDGFGTGNQTFITCDGQPPSSADNNLDCDDRNAQVNPDADEVCNGSDDDCNTFIDEEDPNLVELLSWYVDADNDGYGDPDAGAVVACRPPAPTGYATNPDDCDDGVRQANPGNPERTCDNIDNDCDSSTPDDPVDGDADGFTVCDGDCNDEEPLAFPGGVEVTCTGIDEDCEPLTPDDVDADNDGFSVCDGDCDDSRPAVNPGSVEVLCNGADDDCDPVGTPDDPNIDADGDGFTVCQGDCNDMEPAANPLGTEVQCNGIDEDCDPLTRDDEDADGDGFSFCGDDCDDTDRFVAPGRPEITCNAQDDDCDPATPDDEDADGDGYFLCIDDCEDGDASINPGAQEVCGDGIDNDCDRELYTPCDTGYVLTTSDEAVLSGTTAYTGTRTLSHDGLNSGHNFCTWAWDAVDWDNDPAASGPDPISTSCTDADGNPCVFQFTVNLHNGEQLDGDCSQFGIGGPAWTDQLGVGIGLHPNYQLGGVSYGQVSMYYALGSWYGYLDGDASFVSPNFSGSRTTGTGAAPY